MSGLHRTLVDQLLEDQAALSAVEKFSRWHESSPLFEKRYRSLLASTKPATGQQYAFEVDLDACTGCKACVAACHSLNGLRENEAWRSAGSLLSVEHHATKRQTITTACHHCVDPGCANGCPTLAYEKDATTGIVRHLDDQCMGCSYCTLTCPYEVPQMQPKLGIVRKCDMCRQRLDVGEAPACVQSCPNGAIKIILIEKEQVIAENRKGNSALLPTAPSSQLTIPSTRYISRQPLPQAIVPEVVSFSPRPAHWPLVFMLVLTQWGVGALTAGTLFQYWPLLAVGFALSSFGGAASMLHLGRPLQAWKAWMGWRKSWLSREAIIFGTVPAAAGLAVVASYLGWHPALTLPGMLLGLIGVFCSARLYHVTGKQWWLGARTHLRFFATAFLLGTATAWCFLPHTAILVTATALLKLFLEWHWHQPRNIALAQMNAPSNVNQHGSWAIEKSIALARQHFQGLLHVNSAAYLITALASLAPLPIYGKVFCLLLLGMAEILERSVFFRACVSPVMPGWNPSRSH